MHGKRQTTVTPTLRAEPVLAWLIAALLVLAGGGVRADDQCAMDRVGLRGDWGQAWFSIELAGTEAERARGLMHRDALPRMAGMLFVYDPPTRASFWMKNTLIPLDMLFVGPDGTVQHVHHNARPGDLSPVTGGDNIRAVLEINGGLARRYGIGAGSQLRHSFFSDGPAAWPC